MRQENTFGKDFEPPLLIHGIEPRAFGMIGMDSTTELQYPSPLYLERSCHLGYLNWQRLSPLCSPDRSCIIVPPDPASQVKAWGRPDFACFCLHTKCIALLIWGKN